MAGTRKHADLIRALDMSIHGFQREGRLGRERATRRASRLTGLDWTFSALLILEGMRETEMVRMTELAELVGTTPPTVTKLVKELEGKGLIARTPDEQDGRASIVTLTEAGKEVADAIVAARLEALQQVMADWSDEDLRKLAVLFERLRTDMRHLS